MDRGLNTLSIYCMFHESKGNLFCFGAKLPIPVPRVPIDPSAAFHQGKLPSKTWRNWRGSYRVPSVYQISSPHLRAFDLGICYILYMLCIRADFV